METLFNLVSVSGLSMIHFGFKESCRNYLIFHDMIIVIYFKFYPLADVYVGGNTAHTNFWGRRFLGAQSLFMALCERKKHRTLGGRKMSSSCMDMSLHPSCSLAHIETFIDY